MLARFLYDEHGKARPRRMIAVFATVIPLALFGSFLLALTPMLSGHEGFQTLWVIFSVFLLKFPLVVPAVVVHHAQQGVARPAGQVERRGDPRDPGLPGVGGRAGEGDARRRGARLAYLQREAWNVADRVGGEVKAEAVDTAVHIDHMISRQRSPRTREA